VGRPNGGTTGTGINAASNTGGRERGSRTNDSPKKRACPRFSVLSHYEAVKKLGQVPSRPLIFQGLRRFRSETVPFFHSLYTIHAGIVFENRFVSRPAFRAIFSS
jgi:hypothetical protein